MFRVCISNSRMIVSGDAMPVISSSICSSVCKEDNFLSCTVAQSGKSCQRFPYRKEKYNCWYGTDSTFSNDVEVYRRLISGGHLVTMTYLCPILPLNSRSVRRQQGIIAEQTVIICQKNI